MQKKPFSFDYLYLLVSLLIRLIGVTSLFVCGNLYAVSQMKFQQYSSEQGLPSDVVFDIEKDRNGFVWFATEEGLVKYNGYDIEWFKNASDNPDSLSHNYVRCLALDKDGLLWVGTESGLNVYLENENRFQQVKIGPSAGASADINIIRTIYSDDGFIWIGSYAGLSRYDKSSDTHTHYPHFPVRAILRINQEKLIIGTLGHGAYIFDEITNQFRKLNIDTTAKLFRFNQIRRPELSIIDFERISENEILVGTWGDGIYKYDSNSELLTKLDIPLIDQRVSQIKLNKEKSLWIGTRNGLTIVDQQQNKKPQVTYQNLSEQNNSLVEIRSIFIDNSNHVWLGTYDQGAFKHNIDSQQFDFISSAANAQKGIQGESWFGVTQVNNGDLYFGSEAGTISVLNKNLTPLRQHRFFFQGEIETPFINDLRPFDDDHILVSTRNYSFLMNVKTGDTHIESTKYFKELKNLRVIPYNGRNHESIFLYDEKNVYLASLNNVDGNLVMKKRPSPFSELTGVYLRENDAYFLGSHGGVFKYPLDLGTPKYQIVTTPSGVVATRLVVTDSEDILISTSGDGIVMSSADGATQSLNQDSGLLSSNIMGIALEEEGKYLWASTTQGLSRIDLDSFEVLNFTENDGLQSDDFSEPIYLTSDGYMYFIGSKGATRFRPKNIQPSKVDLEVVLTKFFLDGTVFNSSVEPGAILNKSISNTVALELPYDQKSFGFEFSIDASSASKRITYAYFLDGYDKSWNHVNHKKRYANYTNIEPGNYTFRVKARDKNGNWSDNETKISITITPPWWQTSLAYTIYFLSTILIIYSFIIFRTRKLKMQARNLQSLVAQRTSEVEQLLSRKNEEFENVSHEFRTPLTLILGPLSQLIKDAKKADEKNKLSVIQRNAYRLLRMVDQLLNMETFRVKSITERSVQDFGRSLTLAIEAFKNIAKEKKIKIINQGIESICFDFTPDAFDKIVLNLLSNAIKYTPAEGQVTVESKRTSDNKLVVIVSDTGVGIPKDKQEEVFQRFSRITNSQSERVTGAGIGLALVKDLVERHSGHIELESKEGVGTRITISLPIINESSPEHKISQSENEHQKQELFQMELMSLSSQHTSNSQTNNMPEQSSSMPTALVIEDNPDMRAYIQENLERNYRVLLAKNGEEGVSIAEVELPDVIISDIMMPGLNGYQVTKLIRSNMITSHIPIILLTAKGDVQSRLKGWQENVDEYLTKPFSPDELQLRIRNLLDIRSILKKRFSELAFKENVNSHSPRDNSNDLLENNFINKLNELLSGIYDNSDTKMKNVATEIGMSERQFSRKLKSVVDLTPTEYLRRYRMERARELLANGKTASFTAFEVGFTSQSYFTRCFKAQYGKSPSEYRSEMDAALAEL